MAFGQDYGYNYGIAAAQQAAPPLPSTYSIFPVPASGWIGDVVKISAYQLYTKVNDTDFSIQDNINRWVISGNGQYSTQYLNGSRYITVGGAAGSSIILSSTLPYKRADISLSFEIAGVSISSPTDFVDYVSLQLIQSSLDYIKVSRRWNPDFGHVFEADLMINGVSYPAGVISTTMTTGSIRIIQALNSVTVMAMDQDGNWDVLAYARDWSPSFISYVNITSSNYTTNDKTMTKLIYFESQPNVLYGSEPSTATTASVYELATLVPDPRWYRTENTEVTLTLFDSQGVRGQLTNGFKYVRRGYQRIKQDNVSIIDWVGSNIPNSVPITALPYNVPFKLPGRLPFS